MKKEIIIIGLLVILAGCSAVDPSESAGLSEMQIEACNTADEAGTCNSRLVEVGIVLKEECCTNLGKCCEGGQN